MIQEIQTPIFRNVAVGALSAGGKTSVGDELRGLLKLGFRSPNDDPPWQVVDLGDIARARAKSIGQTIETEAANRPGEIDLAIEEACREAFRRGNSIVLGRLPWMVASEPEFSADTFRVWIHAEPETRAARRFAQKGGAYDDVLRDVCGRDDSDARRYGTIYPQIQFPPEMPFDLFDLVVSAEAMNQSVIAQLIAECGHKWKKHGTDSFAKFHR